MDLKEFLVDADLVHLVDSFQEEGITLDVLAKANESELALLTTKVVDKIKLRSALDKHRQKKPSSGYVPIQELSYSDSVPVAKPVRQNATLNYFVPEKEKITLQDQQPNILPSPVRKSPDPKDLSFILEDGFSIFGDFNILTEENCEDKSKGPQENDESQRSSQENAEENSEEKGSGENLRRLLLKETTGKCLLDKAEKGHELSSRDRAYIVKVVVEAELRLLDKLHQTIRRNVWLKWANEIATLFKGEPRSLYYVPYHVIGEKVIQASGLIHNRLITHRRSLASDSNRKRSKSDSSDSGRSSKSSHSVTKRVRPLPDEFKARSDNSSSEQLDWLRGSSSPYDVVVAKWQATFELRAKLLESGSYLEYFDKFPALKLPNGYQLLTTDFESVYKSPNKTFGERFPLIKLKLLQLLAERGESSRAEQSTIELLELASVGEEQANVAAFLAIVALLRQMPTICVPKKKVWKLSREEVKNGFLARVAVASDIETYCIQREHIFIDKGIPIQPFILAVGPSWENIWQYEIVINKGLRYQVTNVCAAVMHTYNIYWALDCAYPRDSAPCWMLIQRAMFQMSSKYDTEGVPLRELLKQLEAPTK